MENRFGVKDFFLFAFLAAVVGLVILGIVQVDRQWKVIQAIQVQNEQHTKDLVEIRRMLSEGIAVAAPTTPSGASAASAGPDPFKPLKEAEQMPGFARGDWL